VFPDYLKGQNDFLKQFLAHEKSYLDHLLDLEIPPNGDNCLSCGFSEAQFRCLDCYGPSWWCQGCLIKTHSQHPFHRPQKWTCGSFENISLCDLGYVFVLGPSNSSCRCKGSLSVHEQLFIHRLFPSTFDRPETAFTLDVLEYYGIDSMECKTSAQSFFNKLRRVTNNAFPDEVPVRLLIFYNGLWN
jgi:hypothetical protein